MESSVLLFLSSQERVAENAWGASQLSGFADPSSNMSAKRSTSAYITDKLQKAKISPIATCQHYYHSGAPMIPISAVGENMRSVVQLVAPVSGATLLLGVEFHEGVPSEETIGKVRVIMVKAVAQLYAGAAMEVAEGDLKPRKESVRDGDVVPLLGGSATKVHIHPSRWVAVRLTVDAQMVVALHAPDVEWAVQLRASLEKGATQVKYLENVVGHGAVPVAVGVATDDSSVAVEGEDPDAM